MVDNVQFLNENISDEQKKWLTIYLKRMWKGWIFWIHVNGSFLIDLDSLQIDVVLPPSHLGNCKISGLRDDI